MSSVLEPNRGLSVDSARITSLFKVVQSRSHELVGSADVLSLVLWETRRVGNRKEKPASVLA